MKTSRLFQNRYVRGTLLGFVFAALIAALFGQAAPVSHAQGDQPSAKGGYINLNTPATIVAGLGNQPFRVNIGIEDGNPNSTFTMDAVKSYVDNNDGSPVKADSLPSSYPGHAPFETESGMYVYPTQDTAVTFYDTMSYNHPDQVQHAAYGGLATWIGSRPISGTVRLYLHSFDANQKESRLTGGRNYSVVLQASSLGASDVTVTNVGNNGGLTGFSYGGYNAFRTPLRVMMDYQWFNSLQAKNYLQSLTLLSEKWNKNKVITAVYGHDGTAFEDYETAAAYSGALSHFMITDKLAAKEIYETKILGKYYEDENDAYWDDPDNYYTQNMGWFGTALYSNQLLNLWK